MVCRNEGRVKMNTHSVIMYNAAITAVITSRLVGHQVMLVEDFSTDRCFVEFIRE